MNLTLIRVVADDAQTFVVVRSELAVDVLARFGSAFEEMCRGLRDAPDGVDPACLNIDTVPWSVLPGVRQQAIVTMNGMYPGAVVFVGTAVGGTWTSWHPPIAPPPVPPAGQS